MEVGRVVRAHGIGGAVLVKPSTDVAERFEPGSELEAVSAAGTRRTLRVTQASAHGDGLRVKFENVSSRDEAEELRGSGLEVSRATTPPAPEGSFYYFELVGCECVDATAGPLGTVEQIVEDGGGLLLEVGNGATTVSIPFVRDFIRSVDIVARRIELDLPEGLLETCAST